jgi:uncharacterized protein
MAKTFREAIQNYIAAEAIPREKFGHQPRLYALACLAGEGHSYDDDVVFAAAWLHDLGVFAGHRPEDPNELARWDNTAYAIRRAPDLLRGFDFPESKIGAVVEAIRTHQPAGDPTTIEGQILRDADILEQLGAIAVLRTVCKIGRDTRFATFADALKSLRKSLETLPAQLSLETSKRLAKSKIQTLHYFLEAAECEADASVCPREPNPRQTD